METVLKIEGDVEVKTIKGCEDCIFAKYGKYCYLDGTVAVVEEPYSESYSPTLEYTPDACPKQGKTEVLKWKDD